MRFSSAKFMVPAALAALVGIAGLSPVPSACLLPEAQAQGLPPQGPGTRLLSISGRGYSARVALTVLIGGAPLPDDQANQRLNCSLNLTSLDGQPVGQLPARFSVWARSGNQYRLITLERVGEAGGNTPVPGLSTATYIGSTRPFTTTNPNGDAASSANVQLQWREGRRIRFAGFGFVPMTVIPLP